MMVAISQRTDSIAAESQFGDRQPLLQPSAGIRFSRLLPAMGKAGFLSFGKSMIRGILSLITSMCNGLIRMAEYVGLRTV